MQVGKDGLRLANGAPQWKVLKLGQVLSPTERWSDPYPARFKVDEAFASKVGSPLAGRVTNVFIELGQPVKAGQPLFAIASPDIAELRAGQQKSAVDLDVAKAAYERVKAMVEARALPAKDELESDQQLRQAELSLKLAQTKLSSLKVSSSGDNEFKVLSPRGRLGAERDLVLSLRIIATASREPRELVKTGQLHEELYRRLAVFRLDVPALSARKDEVFGLSQRFVEHFGALMNKAVSGLSDEAQLLLSGYAFPGNVGELRGIIERAVAVAKGPLLSAKDLELGEGSWRSTPPPARFFQVDTAGDGVPPSLDAVEQAYVRRVLEHTGGKRMAAAQLLGISYPTFLKRLRELGLDKSDSGVHAAASAPGSSRLRRAH